MAQWYSIHLSMQGAEEIWVWSLGWEDPLEEEMATQDSIIAWKIPWTEELHGLQSMGLQRGGHTKHTHITHWIFAVWKILLKIHILVYLILIITLQTSVTIICSLHIRKWNHVVVEILLKSYKYEVEEPDTLDLSSMLSTTTARLLRYCVKRCKPVGAQTLNQDLC